ncbi:hypothetical protein PIB30_093372 [Stylosanthes scabra]|uniref:F-box associated beta-propeller type 1 domain-containing protein n=1 Tax=Stylosanthes scabra TaxID=79078 RepID=A0ABU6RVP2_9FABA|nr:hypothetical protein [Stylosanthes scabra]
MSDARLPNMNLPNLGNELLWRIFAKTDPKTAVRCRVLNKVWWARLMTPLFAKHNFKENKEKNMHLIVGLGRPPSHENSGLLLRVDMDTRIQHEGTVPEDISHYGNFQIIGSSHGIIYLKFYMGSVDSGIAIWNPLTRKKESATDESRKHITHAVSLYAFGHIFDNLDFAIVHVFKKYFHQTALNWCLYSNTARNWDCTGTFESSVQKLGPTNVVHRGVVYWIGWEGVAVPRPKYVITFNLRTKAFAEKDIPQSAKRMYHTLSCVKDFVVLISTDTLGFKNAINIFQVTCYDKPDFTFERMFRMPTMALPYTPAMFAGKFLITAVEARSGQYCGNDAERTDLLISKHNCEALTSEHLLHRIWREIMCLKSITPHSHGFYKV